MLVECYQISERDSPNNSPHPRKSLSVQARATSTVFSRRNFFFFSQPCQSAPMLFIAFFFFLVTLVRNSVSHPCPGFCFVFFCLDWNGFACRVMLVTDYLMDCILVGALLGLRHTAGKHPTASNLPVTQLTLLKSPCITFIFPCCHSFFFFWQLGKTWICGLDAGMASGATNYVYPISFWGSL